MCLGIPGEVLSLPTEEDAQALRTGRVRFGGIVREVSLDLVPEARVGDYVVVHVGFALSVIDAEEAQSVFQLLRELEEAAL
jgi:hydrogenase expression/formation protein HypC